MSVTVEPALCATIGGIPALSIGTNASRVCSSLLEKPRSKLKSVCADETQGKTPAHAAPQPLRGAAACRACSRRGLEPAGESLIGWAPAEAGAVCVAPASVVRAAVGLPNGEEARGERPVSTLFDRLDLELVLCLGMEEGRRNGHASGRGR